MASRRLEVVLTGDTASLERAFSRVNRSSTGFQRSIKAASTVAVASLAAIGAAAAVGLDELRESEEVTAQTEARLKSTGQAAKVTAGQIGELAAALSRKSGIDDEAIQSSENLLLTFTRIRNEAGAGNDVFNQATQATLNLSVALGKDLNSSALMLGKALNDPIAGLTALGRAGVQFTEQQKAAIEAMVESGNVLGAQKLILAEVEKQVGGSAEAYGNTLTGSVNKARNAFEEMSGNLVGALLPAFTTMAEKVAAASNFLSAHERVTKVAVIAAASLAAGVLAVNAAMKVYSAATVIATGTQIALNVAVSANPYVIAAAAIAALSAATVVAYQRSERFREIVNETWGVVRKVIPAAVFAVSPALGALSAALGGISNALYAIVAAARAAASAISSVTSAAGRVGGIVSTVGGIAAHLPGRAAGGPVQAGHAYMVGERGPEMFVPSRSGTIVPNGGRSVNVYVTMPNYLGDVDAAADAIYRAFLRRKIPNGNLGLA